MAQPNLITFKLMPITNTLKSPRRWRRIASILATVTICSLPLRANNTDSLLRVLDKAIENRDIYLQAKEHHLAELKAELKKKKSDREIYNQNEEIINEYETFVCDSAKSYLRANLKIAERLRDSALIYNSSIRLALIYAMSGQFLQSRDIFDSVDYNSMAWNQKVLYAWSQLKFLENLIISTDEPQIRNKYRDDRLAWRDSLINIFDVNSDLYRKEIAGRCRETGDYTTALTIYKDVYAKTDPESHEAAMVAKGIADIYGLIGDREEQKYFLALSSITDTRLATKENESLLALSEILYSAGEINRAHRYMRVALEDANHYNSRFKNSVIARVYPTVEMSYLDVLNLQHKHLKIILISMVVLICAMLITVVHVLKQHHALSRSKAELSETNKRLASTSEKLAEANLIRELYIGFFMDQCSINLHKFDKFRLSINRKIKANQIEDAYVMSSRPLEKELEELYEHFDTAFLNLYPTFLTEFNNLLKPECRFSLPKGKLNTFVRIYVLIRLGITDMTKIANFLHFSVQTIYNYKSKVRKMSALPPDEFEERVKNIAAQ